MFRYLFKAADLKALTITVTLADRDLELERLPVWKEVEVKLLDLTAGARIQEGTLADLQPGMHLALELGAEEEGLVVKQITATK